MGSTAKLVTRLLPSPTQALGTERARLATFTGFHTEHVRLGTFTGFVIERS